MLRKSGVLISIAFIGVILSIVLIYTNYSSPTTLKQVNMHVEHKLVKYEKEWPNNHLLNKEQKLITKQLEKMSLDEKIGQMIFGGIPGVSLSKETKQLISEYHLGGIIFFSNNIENTKQTVDLVNEIKTINKENKLPILLGIDQEGGRVERLPEDIINLPKNKEIGETNNKEFSYNIGTILGKQLDAYGFNINFAPVLDVHSNPSNPVIGDRSFSADPNIVSDLGLETMKGMKSENIISVIKHFPGHGDTSIDSHIDLPVVSKQREQLNKVELIPFEHAINAGADVVMTAHILLSEIDSKYPASLSKKIITNLLRKQLEYNGVVITDDLTMGAIVDNYELETAAVKAIQAGTDMVLIAHGGYDTLTTVFEEIKSAVLNGEISEDRIDESVRRIIHLKENYELVDEQIENVDIKQLNSLINNILEE